MKETIFVRLVYLSCAWYLAGAVDAKVYQPQGTRKPGIAGCLGTAPSHKVRIRSLKTSNGSVYSRQLVTNADFLCFENSTSKHLPSATQIAECAEATAREGLNSFLWEGGACTAFLAWRHRIRADCKDGGSKVVYVVEEPLKHFAGGDIVVSGEMRYDSPRAFLDISFQHLCAFDADKPKGYILQWNNTDSKEVRRLDEGTTSYSLDYKTLCFISTHHISMWSVDQDGKINSNEVQVPFVRDSDLFGLRTGDCIYHGHTQNTYESATENCNSLGLTQFYEKVDGEASAFLDALDALNIAYLVPFFVGLRLNRTSNRWEWQGGLEQPKVDPDVWAAGQPSDGDWAFAFKSGTSDSTYALHTGTTSYGLTCYAHFIA